MHGWSGEVSSGRWAKADVTLEEEDLRRLLRAHDLADAEDLLTTTEAYRLLEGEAERLILLKLVMRHGLPIDDAKKTADTISAHAETIYTALRTRRSDADPR